jgi:hypothetical protein
VFVLTEGIFQVALGYWGLQPNSNQFAVEWSEMVEVATHAAYYAARETYTHTLSVRAPDAEIWGLRLQVRACVRDRVQSNAEN